MDEKMKKSIDERIALFMQGKGFISRQIVDTPTDNLQVVNRKYVTNNGTLALRPKSSVATVGQPFYATDTFIPMTYSTQGWRNGVGSIVALNN